MWNRICLIILLLYIKQCFALQPEIFEDSLFGYVRKYTLYSLLLNIDDNLKIALLDTDSLFPHIESELNVIKNKKICVNNYCINGCSDIGIPKALYSKFFNYLMSYNKIHKVSFHSLDSLYEETCLFTGVFDNPKCITLVDPPVQIADACALHFSSKTDANGEPIILINDTAYRIVKRKDGSSVLRKMD